MGELRLDSPHDPFDRGSRSRPVTGSAGFLIVGGSAPQRRRHERRRRSDSPTAAASAVRHITVATHKLRSFM